MHLLSHSPHRAVIAGLALCAAAFAQDQSAEAHRVLLFDGTSLTGWTTGSGGAVTKGWVVEDGCMHRKTRGGSLFTAKEYTNFIFEFEWKVASGSNSGIKYRYTSYGKMQNGPEYQVLDDGKHPDGKRGSGKRLAASLYDILAADTAEVKRPTGEWNQGKIVARGPVVEHWLNGKLVLRYDSSTDEFRAAVAKSKFKAHPDYAAKQTGRIMLQDHNDPVWYRNIAITELP